MKAFINYFILFVFISGSSCVNQTQDLKFVENDEGVSLLEGDKELFFYQVKTKSKDGEYPRANYIHPLHGLHGEILTEDFPDDHLHQRGIYWAWHQLFVEDFRVGDPWTCEGIKWDVNKIDFKVDNIKATLNSEVYWVGASSEDTEDNPTRLVKELVKITYMKSGSRYMGFEFDIQLIALIDGIRLGGSEDIKGYGGFSARLFLPDDLSFHSEKGEVIPTETAIQAGNWINMKGTFDQKGVNKSGITIMMDPNYSKPFHGWILREKGSMQNPAFPGSEPISLEKDKSCRMRYMMIIHEENFDTGEINNLYKEFRKGT